jgi:hypothetical protein
MRGPALMTQDHNLQDTPSTGSAKAAKRLELADADVPPAPLGAGPAALLLLGTNAWAASVGWTLLSADVSLRVSALAALGLVVLVVGAVVHARSSESADATGQWSERGQVVARWALLCVYPAALAGALCFGSEAARERVHSPLSMMLAGLSLLAYGIAAVRACRAPLALLPAVSRTRKTSRAHTRSARESMRPLQLAAAAVVLTGAAAIALVAPLVPVYAEVENSWGQAASAGAVLTAVAGGAIAVSIVATQLGLLLRPRRAAQQLGARQRQNRIATLLFLSLLGVVVYFTVIQ